MLFMALSIAAQDKVPKILKYRNMGYTWEETALLARVSYSSISRVSKALRDNQPLPQIYSHQFERKVTDDIINYVVEQTLIQPKLACESLAFYIQRDFNVKLSASTVNRIRHDARFTRKPPKYTQQLTETHKTNRLKFCYTMLALGIPLNDIIFSDESRFVFHDDSGLVWRRYGDENPESTVEKAKYEPGLMVYAAIGVNYKSRIVIIEDSVDTLQYWIDLQDSGMFERDPASYIFMQDGAPAHTAKRTYEFLQSRCNTLKFWPANSPDLNPIEHLWAHLKAVVRTYIHNLPPGTKVTNEMLKAMIQTAYDNIDMDYINNLVTSFHNRLLHCIQRGGESINGHWHNPLPTAVCPCPSPDLILPIEDLILPYDPTAHRIEIPQELCQPLPANVVLKKGHWDSDDDSELIRLHRLYGTKWHRIGPLVLRKPNSCKNRFAVLMRQGRILDQPLTNNQLRALVAESRPTVQDFLMAPPPPAFQMAPPPPAFQMAPPPPAFQMAPPPQAVQMAPPPPAFQMAPPPQAVQMAPPPQAVQMSPYPQPMNTSSSMMNLPTTSGSNSATVFRPMAQFTAMATAQIPNSHPSFFGVPTSSPLPGHSNSSGSGIAPFAMFFPPLRPIQA